MALKQTPSQTVGPFFAYGLTAMESQYPGAQIANGSVVDAQTPGTHIRIIGRILDGAGAVVPDALVEIWQADSAGRHAASAAGNTGFRGFGRQNTGVDPEGRFIFSTIKPGSVDGKQAPHMNFTVLMRGLLSHLYTRLYFPDETAANARDPALAKVPAARRATLIARPADLQGEHAYFFDDHLRWQVTRRSSSMSGLARASSSIGCVTRQRHPGRDHCGAGHPAGHLLPLAELLHVRRGISSIVLERQEPGRRRRPWPAPACLSRAPSICCTRRVSPRGSIAKACGITASRSRSTARGT